MKHLLLPLFCLVAFGWCGPVQGKPHKKNHSPAAPAGTPYPEAAPIVEPGALPSASLQPFLDTHLARILAPLGQPGMDQPEIIASLKAAYADGMTAAPAARKPAYQVAQNVCDALASAMTERQKAAAALVGATATHSSESVQPRGGRRFAQVETQDTNNFFVNSQKNDWVQRSGTLRQNITALYQREREIERQITAPPAAPGTAASPAPGGGTVVPTASVAPTAPTPSVSAPGAR